MGKAKETEAVEKVEKPAEPAKGLLKSSILRSKRFAARRDALSVLLKDDVFYTIPEVERILDDFMKGQVK